MTGTGDLSDLGRAADAAAYILATRGQDALSVRAIALELNLTGPALTHRWDNKERLWRLLVSELGQRWLRVVDDAVRDDGPCGLVPGSDTQVTEARIWLAVADLGRHDPNLAFRVADTLSQERGLMRYELEVATGRRLSEPVVDALHAMAVGLRERVCSVGQPWSVAEARAAWQSAVEVLVPDLPVSRQEPESVAARSACSSRS